MRVGSQTRVGTNGPSRRLIRCFSGQTECTAGDSSPGEDSMGGTTSGALSSVDDFACFNSQEMPQPVVVRPPPQPTLHSAQPLEELSGQTAPRPGFCPSDYQPLSTLGDSSPDIQVIPSPPRKRCRAAGRYGKIMKKEAYFKGISWTRSFVTGLLDPEHNKYKFYCQICKSNVYMYSKGARDCPSFSGGNTSS